MFSWVFEFVASFPDRPDAPFWWLAAIGLLAGTTSIFLKAEEK